MSETSTSTSIQTTPSVQITSSSSQVIIDIFNDKTFKNIAIAGGAINILLLILLIILYIFVKKVIGGLGKDIGGLGLTIIHILIFICLLVNFIINGKVISEDKNPKDSDTASLIAARHDYLKYNIINLVISVIFGIIFIGKIIYMIYI